MQYASTLTLKMKYSEPQQNLVDDLRLSPLHEQQCNSTFYDSPTYGMTRKVKLLATCVANRIQRSVWSLSVWGDVPCTIQWPTPIHLPPINIMC